MSFLGSCAREHSSVVQSEGLETLTALSPTVSTRDTCSTNLFVLLCCGLWQALNLLASPGWLQTGGSPSASASRIYDRLLWREKLCFQVLSFLCIYLPCFPETLPSTLWVACSEIVVSTAVAPSWKLL